MQCYSQSCICKDRKYVQMAKLEKEMGEAYWLFASDRDDLPARDAKRRGASHARSRSSVAGQQGKVL